MADREIRVLGAMLRRALLLIAAAICASAPAWAGPPYVTDDPQPTDYKHFEIYAFAGGTTTGSGNSLATGIDFNYGGAPDLQLTAVVPLAIESARVGRTERGIGNIEVAAKYRFLHQETDGIDMAIFPRAFLPSLSHNVGEQHASFLIPLWLEKDFGKWSVFGGAGYAFNRSGESRDYSISGLAVTRKVFPGLTAGAEIYRQTANAPGSKTTTGVDAGITYDLSENYHLMATYGPGIQNAGAVNRDSWYAALQFTW